MSLHNDTEHQRQQIKLIDQLVSQVENNKIKFSVVSAVENFEADPRLCLTGIHFLKQELKTTIAQLQTELKMIAPDFYYYPASSLHLTIKNVRTIADPPSYTAEDVIKAQQAFAKVAATAKKFKTYFYRFIVFPESLALIGTTSPERDDITIALDQALNQAGVPDDKTYINQTHFFANVTLARFSTPPTKEFLQKINELTKNLKIPSYEVDSLSLVTANAAIKKKKIVQTWQLN